MELCFFGDKEKFKEIESKIKIFMNKSKMKFNITFHENVDIFFADISKKNIDIIFLLHSKEFEEILDLTTNIKKINKNYKIIFCSETEKFALKGYKVGINYYILFPVEYSEIEFIFKKIINKNETIIIKSNWQKISIFIDNIQFAEKQGHNVIIHTTNETFSTRTTFRSFAENFKNKNNFINCIKGTIVNLNWVLKIASQNFVMKNGQKIPIRRKDRAKIKELFFKHNLKKE